MKLKKGQTVTIGKRTYKDEVPDELMAKIEEDGKKTAARRKMTPDQKRAAKAKEAEAGKKTKAGKKKTGDTE